MHRTESVLLIDKKMKHNNFLTVLEKDLKNLLNVYFAMENESLCILLSKGDLGNLNLCINLKNIRPKKIGINA